MEKKQNMSNVNVLKNFFWRLLERFGAQIVTFVVSIVLARLLEPEAYGIISIVTIFTTLLQVFVDSGMANALIQKKNADDLDFSTVFYFNVSICIILYWLMFAFAPLIAKFYDIPLLKSVVRVVSLSIVVSGVKNVQQAYVSKNMLFKKFFYSTVGGNMISAVVGIAMAYKGYGVWALAFQHLTNSVFGTIILWINVKWRPICRFSIKRLRGLFSYGSKLLIAHFLEALYNDLRSLIIGKKYTTTDLSFFDKGKFIPSMVATNINSSIDSVLLPAMSSEQDDINKIKSMTRRSIKISSYLMWPLMLGLAACAESIVSLILTAKWLPCVTYLRVFCVTFAFHPIQTANLNAIKAIGNSGLYLKLSVAKKIVGFSILVVTMWFGVPVMAYALIGESIITQIINSWPNRKILNYGYLEQLKDILPSLGLAIFMAICVWFENLLPYGDFIKLVIQVSSGALIYIVGSRIFHVDSFEYVFFTVKKMLKRG